MTRARRVAVNGLFAIAFLAGLAAIWVGLEALTFGGPGARRGLLALASGFGLWLALAAITGAAARRRGDGERR